LIRSGIVSWNDPTNLRWAFTEGAIQLQGEIIESVVIRNLTALDFQVFEDGKEQSIQNVKYEQTPYWVFHDNKGYHSELLGEGGEENGAALNGHRGWPPFLARAITS
jgi:hypothetical protein